jgi:hypothetical protein
MKRLTETMVLRGSTDCLACASKPTSTQGTTEFVVEHHRLAAAHGGDQRIGGAEIDADREPVLVGRHRFARFGNLQQCHWGVPMPR